MNPLYEQMNGQQNGIIQRFMQFKQNFKGDPRQQVQEMLNSGRITQEQYNAAVQKAQMLQKMLGM
jgi:hypothetical protein